MRLRDAYELLLALVAGFLLALPWHASRLEHLDVRRTLDDHTALAPADGLRPGQRVEAYRFNPSWQLPIGTFRVDRVSGADAVLVAEGPLRWPLGRHGRVVTEDGGQVVVDVGTELSLEVGRNLGVYEGRRWLGDVRLTEVGRGRSVARVTFAPPRPLGGLGVTEYTVATQVVARDDRWWRVLGELLLGLLPTAAWLAVRLRTGRSPADAVRERWLATTSPTTRARGRALAEAASAAVLVGAFAPSAASLVAARGLVAAGVAFDPWPAVAPWIPWSTAVVGAAALAAGLRGWSPLGAVAALTRWDRSLVAQVPDRWRPAVSWALHLAVVWAFGSTLWGFLVADVQAIRDLVSAGPLTAGVVSEVARLVLWSATIVACIGGYAHGVLGPLWGKGVRHLDFTVAGWVTNAACYPLLGLAMARLVGPRCGADPIVSGSVAGALLLAIGFLANLAYTASIWNMGTKFGVMADKGLVTWGFFGVVRHPSYTLEALMFLALEAAGFTTWREWVAGLSIAWLYWLRSEREDAFLGTVNPEYAAYRAQVPHKFLPGWW